MSIEYLYVFVIFERPLCTTHLWPVKIRKISVMQKIHYLYIIYHVGKTMPFLPPMTGSGNHTYISMVIYDWGMVNS